jgi:hypothetical protein
VQTAAVLRAAIKTLRPASGDDDDLTRDLGGYDRVFGINTAGL